MGGCWHGSVIKSCYSCNLSQGDGNTERLLLSLEERDHSGMYEHLSMCGHFFYPAGKNRIAFYDEKRKTILSENCCVAIERKSGDAKRCDQCENHHQTLNRMLYRALNEPLQDKDRTAPNSHTN